MEKYFNLGVKHLLYCFISLISLTCFGQERLLLNRFQFPVKDTVAHRVCFYQDLFIYPDSTVSKIYNLNNILVKEKLHLLDKEKKAIFQLTIEYDSLGNIIGRREKDNNTNIENSFEFYPDGILKSRRHSFNSIPIKEEYFDINGDPVPKATEEIPSPKGGLEGLNRFLANNLNYPNVARRKKQEGTVYIWFKVDTEGNITDPEVMNPEQVHHLLAEEALRVIRKYPHRWTPGIKDGIAISAPMTLPINFSLK